MEAWRKELYHHGIKGQKWGVRRGPPYPLGASQRSSRGTNSLDKRAGRAYSGKQKKSGSGDAFRKALVIGGTATITAVALYGMYRSGQLDSMARLGKSAAREALGKIGSESLKGVAGNFKPSGHSTTPPTPPKPSTPPPTPPKPPSMPKPPTPEKPKRQPVIRDPKTGFKIIHESVEDSLKNANPLRNSGTGEDRNICTYAAVAGFLRSKGYDATAKSTGGKMQNLGGVLEDCFKGVKVRNGSAVVFSQSPEKAGEMLKKRFGDNAEGAVGIDWKGGNGGHAFSWQIRNGVVRFLDYKEGNDDSAVRDYWKFIDPKGDLTFARLDEPNAEINLAAIDKYVNGR